MYLEHVNLVVSDIELSLRFYRAAFPHWSIRSEGQGKWHDKQRRWIHFGDQNTYIAMSDHGKGKNRDLSGDQIGFAHFAFVVRDIHSLIQRMVKAGYEVDNHNFDHPFRKNAYLLDPNGFEVEFVEYLSDLPSEQNSD